MCPLPNESLAHRSSKVTGQLAIAQVRHALQSVDKPEMVCIYNDGSFFAEAELIRETRLAIVDLVRASGATVLMVESLPEFINKTTVGEVAARLSGRTQLVVGLGLQSADRIVREVCIASPVTEDAFRRALSVLSRAGVDAKTYLMFKPPFLTEDEAVSDVLSSVAWVSELGTVDITVCPTRVASGTVVHDLYRLGLYSPPALVSVAQAMQCLHDSGLHARVSLFNVASSDFPSITPRVCASCGPRTVAALTEYNRDPRPGILNGVGCNACAAAACREIEDDVFCLQLEQRICAYLEAVAQPIAQSSR